MKIDITTILLLGGAAVAGYWLLAMGGKEQIMGMLGGLGGGKGPSYEDWATDHAIAPRESDFDDMPPIKQAGTNSSGSNMQHLPGHTGTSRGYLGQVSFF